MTAYELVQQQAERPELWCVSQRIAEAILQAALRELHAAVEQEAAVHGGPVTDRIAPTPAMTQAADAVPITIVEALFQLRALSTRLPVGYWLRAEIIKQDQEIFVIEGWGEGYTPPGPGSAPPAPAPGSPAVAGRGRKPSPDTARPARD